MDIVGVNITGIEADEDDSWIDAGLFPLMERVVFDVYKVLSSRLRLAGTSSGIGLV